MKLRGGVYYIRGVYSFGNWCLLGHLRYIDCLQVANTTSEDHEVIPVLRSLFTDNPSSPGKVGHTTGVYVPQFS